MIVDEEYCIQPEDQMEDIREIEKIGRSLLTKAEAQNYVMLRIYHRTVNKGNFFRPLYSCK